MTVTRTVTRTPAILVTVGTLRSLTAKNDESYENGTSEASKTRTVTRTATWTPAIPVTVHTLESPGLAVRVTENNMPKGSAA